MENCSEETPLRRLVPTNTYGLQLEAIGYLLDGDDVLLMIAKGSGKANMFVVYFRVSHSRSTRQWRLIAYLTKNFGGRNGQLDG